jgi:multidrug efflux system outer membrane protein
MIADYNQTIFNVVRDVAQQGAALQGIESQMKHQAGAMQASNDLLRTAQAKFKQGLAERSTVLAAELALSKQQDAELQLENQQLIAEVSLIKALGGGYRTDSTNADNTGAALTQLSK